MPEPAPLVNVQIDGVWHQFPKGTRVIEACAQVRSLRSALLLSPET
jgi:NADH-quinone oxidoreductase subunit G